MVFQHWMIEIKPQKCTCLVRTNLYLIVTEGLYALFLVVCWLMWLNLQGRSQYSYFICFLQRIKKTTDYIQQFKSMVQLSSIAQSSLIADIFICISALPLVLTRCILYSVQKPCMCLVNKLLSNFKQHSQWQRNDNLISRIPC